MPTVAIMIRFWLNDREIHTSEPAGTLVLDFLRRNERLTGTKEGCREGDCGACVVLIGDLENGWVTYRPVTSCLVPLGELHGRHLVTVEGLNVPELNPVQRAIVEEGATQCGFCTPGIVVSMTGMLMERTLPVTIEAVKEALGGHLCRCTGYRSLKAAVHHLDKTQVGIEALVDAKMLPEYFREMPGRLAALASSPEPPSTEEDRPDFLVAGGTDIYVQRGDHIPGARVRILNRLPEMKGIGRRNGHLRVGALTTFEDFARSPHVRKIVPHIDDYMFLIASLQIRHRATLGGNVINASPIGDMTILLLALDAQLVLAIGASSRSVAITDFYRGYKQMDRLPSEVLTEIRIPVPADGTRVNWEKASKRRCLDIATVNSAARTRVEGSVIRDASFAMGGVAPVPLYLRRTSQFVIGKKLTASTAHAAADLAQTEIAPISDVRGSADYKRLLARQFMLAHFSRTYPEAIRVEELYEEH